LSYEAFRERLGLRHKESACLPLRSVFGQCSACAKACPVDAIEVSLQEVALSESCIQCGRCVAACPNDALELESSKLTTGEINSNVIEIECAKVPNAALSSDAVRISCTGSLKLGALAKFCGSNPGKSVEIVDRGWCSSCNVNQKRADQQPAQQVVEALNLLLEAVGGPIGTVQIVQKPLPLSEMPSELPALKANSEAELKPARREFFRKVLNPNQGQKPTPMGQSGRAKFSANTREEAPDRKALLSVLGELAARNKKQVPSEIFPVLHHTGGCVDHRICVAACPTAAIKPVATAQSAALEFSATSCIACGACIRACPEGALSLAPAGGSPYPQEVVRHEQKVCAVCSDAFTPRADETTCLPCTKSRQFMGDAMTKLFGKSF
jgi:Fe-S-cluster-containing hydrogenase component 2